MTSNSIYHKHHIIPKHAGGSNDSSNLIKLTIEEHAEAHHTLYKEHGRWQDRLAWKTLSGQITNAEATKQSQKLGRLNKIVSEETRSKISKAKKGVPQSQELIEKRRIGMTGKKRSPRSEEWCNKLSIARSGQTIKGTSHTDETKTKISTSKKGQSYNKGRVFSKICCLFCQKEISFNRIVVHQQSKTCSKINSFVI